MIDLDQINDLSLMNIIFNTTPEFGVDNLEFLNLVFAREGAFICIKSDFGYVLDKTTLPYRNKGLEPLFDDDQYVYYFESFIPKPDITVLEEILEYFKFICGKTKEELLVILYYDTKTKKFITEIVRQIVSGGSVEYAYNKKYEMESRYIKYLEIHSHHSMAANFSGTDNNDESNRTLYFCGVLGKINPIQSNVFNIDHTFRIWTGLRFIQIPLYEVFETHTQNIELSESKKNELKKIIEVSDIIQNIRRNQQQIITPMNQTGIPTPGFRPNNFQGEAIRSALEDLGVDPDDPDILDQLDDDDLDNLPILWRNSPLNREQFSGGQQ